MPSPWCVLDVVFVVLQWLSCSRLWLHWLSSFFFLLSHVPLLYGVLIFLLWRLKQQFLRQLEQVGGWLFMSGGINVGTFIKLQLTARSIWSRSLTKNWIIASRWKGETVRMSNDSQPPRTLQIIDTRLEIWKIANGEWKMHPQFCK